MENVREELLSLSGRPIDALLSADAPFSITTLISPTKPPVSVPAYRRSCHRLFPLFPTLSSTFESEKPAGICVGQAEGSRFWSTLFPQDQ